MKVALYYHSPFGCGGIEKTMYNLGKLLSRKGYDITFVFADNNANTDTLIKWSEVGRVINYNYFKNEEFDYVIYESIYNMKPILCKEKNIQVINCLMNNSMEPYENVVMDDYVSVSEAAFNQFKKTKSKESIIIPNLLIPEDTKELSKEEIDIKKAKYTFVTVSRIDKLKGFDRMIEIIKQLESNKVDYKWYIVGDSERDKYMDNLMKTLKAYSNVVFVGKKDNPYPYIAQSDVLIQLSDYESQCMVMYEAMILGTPVMTTPFDNALKEVNESNGLIVDFDLSNFKVEDLLKLKKLKGYKYEYKDEIDKWLNLLKPVERKDNTFTVLIPNYNNSKYLDKCLNSILSQTYKNYEIIFVDDMSEDNSLEIAKKIIGNKQPAKIIPLKQKRYNGGTRNVGIIEANSDYIICIDSDDWLANDKVLEHINNRLRNEDIMLLGYKQWNGTNYIGEELQKNCNKNYVFKEGTCAIWTKVVKTDLMKQTLFNEGTLMEDRVNHYRLIDKANKITSLGEVTHIWNRTNKSSVSTARNTKWDTSAYRFLADMIDFTNETTNESYKTFVKGRIEEQKKLIAQGKYTQI